MKAAVTTLLAVLALLPGPARAIAPPKPQRPVRVVYPADDARVPPNPVLFLEWQRP